FLHVGVVAFAIVVTVAAAFAHLAGERFVVAILAVIGLPVAVGLELVGLRVVVLAVIAAAAPLTVTVARAVVVPVSHWSLLKFSGKLRRAAWGDGRVALLHETTARAGGSLPGRAHADRASATACGTVAGTFRIAQESGAVEAMHDRCSAHA